MTAKSANLAYKPVGIVGGVLGGLVAKKIANKLWALVSHDDAGIPSRRKAGEKWQKVVAGTALQAAVFAAVRTGVDRAGARQFEKWSGEYPAG